MASTINLVLIPFLFTLIISAVSPEPPIPSPSPQPLDSSQQAFTLYNTSTSPPLTPPTEAAPLLSPALPPLHIIAAPPLPRIEEPLNSSQEFTFDYTSTPPSQAPVVQEPLNSSQEFTFDNTSTSPSQAPMVQEPLNPSQEFTFNNTSTPPSQSPRIQEPLNSSQELTLNNTSTPPPLPGVQDFSQEFTFNYTTKPPSLVPRIQELLNSSQEFTLNNTSIIPVRPFLRPSTIETTPPPPVVEPLNSSALRARTPLVPAFFILGDSSVDSGTNNYLGTLARADRPPYGRDFDTHQPTGRFCNGRIPVDFLALRLGLPFVPSYLGQNGTVKDMLQGVNYASAGAGIIFSSGLELGQRVSFTQQIQQFTDTLQTFILNMGEDAATDLISKSVIYISVGINDYIHYYLRNASNVQNLYFPWSFNQFLAYTLKNEIKNLYAMNVRKVVVMGLPPIGCAPHYLWKYSSNNGKCIQEINDMVMEFNFIMRYIVQGLRGELPGANVIFCDVYEASMDILENSEHYGFNVNADACCGWGRYRGWIMCLSPEMACKNASNHIWWDQYHPTDAVNSILADNVWNGLHAKICYPMNLEEMVTPKAN